MAKIDTIVIMVSIGDRCHISDYTFPRLSDWASKHGYSALLLKKEITDKAIAPHFNKLIAHSVAPGFKRYIIIDDDLMLKKDAPAMETVPRGYVGLCADVVQSNTEAPHVSWTANTGFIVTDDEGTKLLEEAFWQGEYPFKAGDQTGLAIWGPHDQATVNDILYKYKRIYRLDGRWNYQAVIEYYDKGKGWDYWRNNRMYRLLYYFSAYLNFAGINRKNIKRAYGIHMTMGLYPKFFSKIHH